MVYALLKSGRVYDRTILENAIERRREQAAQSTHGRPRKAFPAPAPKNLGPHHDDDNNADKLWKTRMRRLTW